MKRIAVSAVITGVVDRFSWQSFVALNWPANPDGTANGTASLGSAGPNVFDYYKAANGATPDSNYPTKNLPPPPAVCTQANTLTGGAPPRVLTMSAKEDSNTNFTDSFNEAAVNVPLIDSKGNFVVYDVSMNKDADLHPDAALLLPAAEDGTDRLVHHSQDLALERVDLVVVRARQQRAAQFLAARARRETARRAVRAAVERAGDVALQPAVHAEGRHALPARRRSPDSRSSGRGSSRTRSSTSPTASTGRRSCAARRSTARRRR